MAKIAAVQMMAEDSMEKNYRKSLSFIKRAAKAGASMVCFPEGQLTRYIPQYPGLSPVGHGDRYCVCRRIGRDKGDRRDGRASQRYVLSLS